MPSGPKLPEPEATVGFGEANHRDDWSPSAEYVLLSMKLMGVELNQVARAEGLEKGPSKSWGRAILEAARRVARDECGLTDEEIVEFHSGQSGLVAGNSVTRITVGRTAYQLQNAATATSSEIGPGRWTFEVGDFSPPFFGRGGSPQQAQRDWCGQIHRAVQTLLRLRPFRMSDEQREQWKLLSGLIDLEHYRRTAPQTRVECGVVTRVYLTESEVTWVDDEQTDTVSVCEMPPLFCAFEANQWFEAIVERDRDAGTLRRVVFVKPINPPKGRSWSEIQDWYRALPTTARLPKSNSDWSSL